MKRVLQKQRSAFKFLAAAKPTQVSESSPTRTLLSAKESDNLFITLEEDFNEVLKTVSAESSSDLKKRMQKLWSLILTIRRSETMLRELYTKMGGKQLTKADSSVKNLENEVLTDADIKSDPASGKVLFAVSKAELEANKEMFEKEKQYLLKEIVVLKEKLGKYSNNVVELEKNVKEYEKQVKELKNNLETQTSETVREFRLRQNCELRVRELHKQVEQKEKEIEDCSFQLNSAKEQIKLYESTVNEQKLTNELLSQNNTHLSQKILKLQTDYNSQTSTLEDLTQKYMSLSNQAKIYEDNAAKMLSDLSKNSKMKDMCQKKVQFLETQKRDLQNEREKLSTSIRIMEKDVENWQNLFENEKRCVEELKREKELLLKNYQRINVANDEQQRILKIEVRMKDQLEAEVNHLNKELTRQKDAFSNLQKEEERLKSKNLELQNYIAAIQIKLGEKKSLIFELRKELNELQANYKHQSNLLENIRKDKNLYSQNLTQTKEEVTELKQELKTLSEKVEKEKENIIEKENELLTEKSILQKLEQDKEKLHGEISHYKSTLKRNNDHISELQENVTNLKNIIQKMEGELLKKDKSVLQVITEQELLSTQLLQKSEEITQLNAKLKLWELMREKQESDCKTHVEDIQNLKSEIKRMKTDKVVLDRNLVAVANLRTEVFMLEKELTKQRVKCRALEEELQNPLNIHRWRKLEGTDPNSYELITKIQLLQKRVLSKSEIAAEKEQQLKELETLYENLRTTTSKLSPAEVSNKLYFMRKELDEKNKKIKSLMVEMGMHESHVAEYKQEIEKKNKEIEEIKKEYFKQMSPEMLQNLNDLRLNHQFCDAKIVVENGQTFLAHRAILAGTSKYFCALFTTPLETNTEQEFKVTRLPWVSTSIMEEVLNYTYQRKFDLTPENAFDMYVVCDFLCIDSATEACINFLKQQINEENCIEILSFARAYLCPSLSISAERYTLRNFLVVAEKNTDLLECELKDIINIVGSNHLNVYTEEPVWNFVLKWINYKPEQRQEFVPHILSKIRLGIMNENFFSQQVAQNSYICQDSQCKDIIDSVNTFFRDCGRLQFINEELQTPKFAQPRIPHDIVFAVGGWSIGSPTAVVESYDSRADRWMRPEYMLDPLGARAYHGCAILDNKMHVVGGFDGLEYFNSCRCYDFDRKNWYNIAPMNTRRCYVSVTVLNGMIYAMGGYDGHNRQSTAEKYDPATNQWTLLPNMNVARSDADATTLNGQIYITGGFNGIECLNTAEIYDPQVNEWSLLPPMLFRRSGVSCIAYNKMIYVLGGFDGNIRLRSVERFDPTTETWSTVPDMLSPRSNFAVEVIDDVIIVIGGFNGIGTTHYVECYDIKLNEWRHASDMSLNRSALSACLIQNLTDVSGLVYEQREALMEEKRLALHALLPHTPDSEDTASDNFEDFEM